MGMRINEHSIQSLPKEERPRERLIRHGADSLSLIEILAIILGSGSKVASVLEVSRTLVTRFGGLEALMQATLTELLEVQGIGFAKAIQLKAALNLGFRATRQQIKSRYLIEHSSHAYQLVKDELENENREIFMAIFQDTKGYLITYEVISIGSLSQTLVHPREVFYSAIRHKAASLIVVHNHPSGDPTPSNQDLKLTQTLVEGSRLLGIPLRDHLIIGKNSYVSFKDQKLLLK
ncbi:UPF0758 protein [Candidatus Protochlamydia amoebophila]|nr:UPF0758 protein [Candidatus Protochlamydia amoebophila]